MIEKQKAARSFSSENHWSRRVWVAVEDDPDNGTALCICDDSGRCVLVLVEGEARVLMTEDDRQLANHIIELHNKALKEASNAKNASR